MGSNPTASARLNNTSCGDNVTSSAQAKAANALAAFAGTEDTISPTPSSSVERTSMLRLRSARAAIRTSPEWSISPCFFDDLSISNAIESSMQPFCEPHASCDIQTITASQVLDVHNSAERGARTSVAC